MGTQHMSLEAYQPRWRSVQGPETLHLSVSRATARLIRWTAEIEFQALKSRASKILVRHRLKMVYVAVG